MNVLSVSTDVNMLDVGCCVPLRADPLESGQAENLAAAFRALGDPVRLQLINLIAGAEGGRVCACDLVEPVGKSQPTVSHHLRVLREIGLVRTEKQGTSIWYSVAPERLDALQRVLAP
jgi:ArsR family transcriptional regulator